MATLRAEIFRGLDPMDTAIAGSTIAVTGSASTPWAPSYAEGDNGGVSNPPKSVTFEAFGGPVYVAFGKTPDPTAEPRRLVRPGLKVQARIQVGERVSAIAASDIPA